MVTAEIVLFAVGCSDFLPNDLVKGTKGKKFPILAPNNEKVPLFDTPFTVSTL